MVYVRLNLLNDRCEILKVRFKEAAGVQKKRAYLRRFISGLFQISAGCRKTTQDGKELAQSFFPGQQHRKITPHSIYEMQLLFQILLQYYKTRACQ